MESRGQRSICYDYGAFSLTLQLWYVRTKQWSSVVILLCRHGDLHSGAAMISVLEGSQDENVPHLQTDTPTKHLNFGFNPKDQKSHGLRLFPLLTHEPSRGFPKYRGAPGYVTPSERHHRHTLHKDRSDIQTIQVLTKSGSQADGSCFILLAHSGKNVCYVSLTLCSYC